MHLTTSHLLPFILLSQTTLASLAIDDICYYQLPSKVPSIICLRADQPLDQFPKEVSGTAALGATGVSLCCPKGQSCLLSNETNPEVLCYNATTHKASSHSNVRKCDLQGGSCAEGSYGMSDKGVLTVVSIKDGVGSTGSGSGSGSASSASSSATGSAAAATGTGSSKTGAAAVDVATLSGPFMAVFVMVMGGVLAL